MGKEGKEIKNVREREEEGKDLESKSKKEKEWSCYGVLMLSWVDPFEGREIVSKGKIKGYRIVEEEEYY